MGNFKNMHKEQENDDALTVVVFMSRNKDNKEIPDFKERRNAFTVPNKSLDTKDGNIVIDHLFHNFVKDGKPGELSRLYMSVNKRSNEKTFIALQHEMLNGKFNLATIPQKIASIAARKENAYDPKNLFWLFDFDRIDGLTDDEFEDKIQEFVEDVKLTYTLTKGEYLDGLMFMRKTVTGAAIVISDHFDTRELLKRWPNVTLKRDDLMLVTWKENAKSALIKSMQSSS
jgi:hypothetical protein